MKAQNSELLVTGKKGHLRQESKRNGVTFVKLYLEAALNLNHGTLISY